MLLICSKLALSSASIVAGSPGVKRNGRNMNSATTAITGMAASKDERIIQASSTSGQFKTVVHCEYCSAFGSAERASQS